MKNLIQNLRTKTRSARRAVFQSFLTNLRRTLPDGDTRILKVLDLGGTAAFWEGWWNISAGDRLEITLVNNHVIDKTQEGKRPRTGFLTDVNRDATSITVEEFGQFDLIFSNSFLEHLRNRKDQALIAERISASGRPYFIQVPNKNSPVDPHFPFAPFFAIWPLGIKARMLTLTDMGSGGRRVPSVEEARRRLSYYSPLGLRDMLQLFPAGSHKVERPFGVPMSILVYRPA